MKAQIKEIGEIVIAGRKFLEVIPGETNVDFKSEWMNFFEDIKENFDMKNYKDSFGLCENMKMVDGKPAMDYVICMRKEAFDKSTMLNLEKTFILEKFNPKESFKELTYREFIF